MAKSLSQPDEVATTIAQVVCHNNELPRGSRASLLLSNMIAAGSIAFSQSIELPYSGTDLQRMDEHGRRLFRDAEFRQPSGHHTTHEAYATTQTRGSLITEGHVYACNEKKLPSLQVGLYQHNHEGWQGRLVRWVCPCTRATRRTAQADRGNRLIVNPSANRRVVDTQIGST